MPRRSASSSAPSPSARPPPPAPRATGWVASAALGDAPAGVALVLALSGASLGSDEADVLRWVERALPVAERLELLPQITMGLQRQVGGRFRANRPRQALS